MAYNNLANVLTLSRRTREAESLLRRGLKLQPLAYQYNGLGNLRLKRRGAAGAEEAARLFRGAIAQERSAAGCGAAPMEHAYRFNLGNALSALGRAAEARAEYAAAAALRPDSREYRAAAGAESDAAAAAATATATAAAAAAAATAAPSTEGDGIFHDAHSLPAAPLPRPAGWGGGGPHLALVVGPVAPPRACAPAAAARAACACAPPAVGVLQDVGATAAALAAAGWAVEVYACAPAAELGVDASGVLWLPSYRYSTEALPPHVLLSVDAPPPPAAAAAARGGCGSARLRRRRRGWRRRARRRPTASTVSSSAAFPRAGPRTTTMAEARRRRRVRRSAALRRASSRARRRSSALPTRRRRRRPTARRSVHPLAGATRSRRRRGSRRSSPRGLRSARSVRRRGSPS